MNEPRRRPATETDLEPVRPRLRVEQVPHPAALLTVNGRRVTAPDDGFGPLWRKVYAVRIGGAATATDVVAVWKARFGDLWPAGSCFYSPPAGIAPGAVAVLRLSPLLRGLAVWTGVLVAEAGPTGFAFRNAEGHMFAGGLRFRATERAGAVVAEIEATIRAGDPLWELAIRLGGYAAEDAFWAATLRALSSRFGPAGEPSRRADLLDGRRRWSRAGNIRRNAALLSLTAELRRAGRAGPAY